MPEASGTTNPIAGPHDPLLTTPARRVPSIRRTTSIDSTRGRRGAPTAVEARARDLRTDPDGTAETVAEQRLVAALDTTTGIIRSLVAEPALRGVEVLVGWRVGGGFRQAVSDMPDLTPGSLLAHLLDDWPGAHLVSGYALQRRWSYDGAAVATPHTVDHAAQVSDICAGWASDGSMMVTIGRTGTIPTPYGPPLPADDTTGDDLAWHAIPRLPAGSTRRRRRTDLWPVDDVTFGFETHFRDSYAEDDTTQSGLHEYVVRGTATRPDLVVTGVEAEARVLPWLECPAARASADRTVGMAVGELRQRVRRELTGVTTCTHLNDTLRSLEDLVALAGLLDGA